MRASTSLAAAALLIFATSALAFEPNSTSPRDIITWRPKKPHTPTRRFSLPRLP